MSDFDPVVRRSALWSTEAAAALGHSPYKTPLALWQEKSGLAEPEDVSGKFAVRLGTAMQPAIALMYSQDEGEPLRDLDGVEHLATVAETPLGAHYDYFNPARLALHEVKCFGQMRRKDFGEAGTDEIPMDVLCQVLHQQAVYLKHGEINGSQVNVAFGNVERLVFWVPLDTDALNALAKRLAAFWALVRSGEAPPVTTPEDARALYPRSALGWQVIASPEIAQMCTKLAALKTHGDELEEQQRTLEAAIKAHMGEAEALVFDGATLATWKSSAPAQRLDTKALKAAHPDICAQFTAAGEPSRRFLLK
ncbi:MAG: YqaJ viral recombinase family protein [Sulfuricaulis sp.]|nr:YqaJ viral recombinase family protein [Sulfuricaulis sp.]